MAFERSDVAMKFVCGASSGCKSIFGGEAVDCRTLLTILAATGAAGTTWATGAGVAAEWSYCGYGATGAGLVVAGLLSYFGANSGCKFKFGGAAA